MLTLTRFNGLPSRVMEGRFNNVKGFCSCSNAITESAEHLIVHCPFTVFNEESSCSKCKGWSGTEILHSYLQEPLSLQPLVASGEIRQDPHLAESGHYFLLVYCVSHCHPIFSFSLQ